MKKVETRFQISSLAIDSINELILPKRNISALEEWKAECSLQTECVAFTYRADQDEKCTLYSGENMSLAKQPETNTYFIVSVLETRFLTRYMVMGTIFWIKH